MTKIYPASDVAAFLTWDLPTDGIDMWEWQDGRCAMCGRGQKYSVTLCLDHCHVTGLTRGYLCQACNFAEGKAMVDAAWSWWRVGRNPARLLDQEELWRNPVGFVPRRDRYDRDYDAAGYVIAIQRYGESMGRELSRPFTWSAPVGDDMEDRIIAALDRLT